MVLSYLWGMPWVLLGIGLCITILGIPFGLLCFIIAGIPLSRTVINHHHRVQAWLDSDRPMDNENEVPWLRLVEDDDTK